MLPSACNQVIAYLGNGDVNDGDGDGGAPVEKVCCDSNGTFFFFFLNMLAWSNKATTNPCFSLQMNGCSVHPQGFSSKQTKLCLHWVWVEFFHTNTMRVIKIQQTSCIHSFVICKHLQSYCYFSLKKKKRSPWNYSRCCLDLSASLCLSSPPPLLAYYYVSLHISANCQAVGEQKTGSSSVYLSAKASSCVSVCACACMHNPNNMRTHSLSSHSPTAGKKQVKLETARSTVHPTGLSLGGVKWNDNPDLKPSSTPQWCLRARPLTSGCSCSACRSLSACTGQLPGVKMPLREFKPSVWTEIDGWIKKKNGLICRNEEFPEL